MKDNINNFVQNILYKVSLDLGFKEMEKIRLLGFNSINVEEKYIEIKKLNNEKIKCKGQRHLYKAMKRANKIMENEPKKIYYLLILLFGDVNDQENLSFLGFEMFGLNESLNITPRIIKFINNKSVFSKSVFEEDIALSLIRQLNTRGLESVSSIKPLEINEKEPNTNIILKIVEMFNEN